MKNLIEVNKKIRLYGFCLFIISLSISWFFLNDITVGSGLFMLDYGLPAELNFSLLVSLLINLLLLVVSVFLCRSEYFYFVRYFLLDRKKIYTFIFKG